MKKVLLLINIMLLSVLGVPLISVHAAAPVTVAIPMEQKILADIPPEKISDKNFEYTLTPENMAFPMPDGSVDGKYTFSVSGNDFQNISITYTDSGEYYYRLAQQQKEDFQANDFYRILVSVKNTDGGLISQIIAYLPDGDKSDLLFVNTFTGDVYSEVSADSYPPIQESSAISEMSQAVTSDNSSVDTGDSSHAEVFVGIALTAFLISLACCLGKNRTIT